MPPRKYNTVSQDLREAIIRMVVNQGKSERDVAKTLNISRNTIQHIVNKYMDSNVSTPSARGGPRNVIFNDDIREQIIIMMNDNQTKTIENTRNRLGTQACLNTVWRWVKGLGYTYKITRPIYERRNDPSIKEHRTQYIGWYNSHAPSFRYKNLIFIDESPINLHMFRSHSWAMKGVTPNPNIKPRSKNVTVIIALNGDNIVHCEAIMTSVNGEIFKQFLNQVIRILGREEDYVFVVDNVNFHHRSDLFEADNFSIRYLPAYSSFLNPCEEVFYYLKNIVRRNTAPAGTDELISRMRSACEDVPNINLLNYLMHC